MQPETGSGALWLVRPNDVVAHILYMSSIEAPVVLSAPGVRVRGRFLGSGSAGIHFRPLPEDRAVPIALGAPLKVDYHGAEDEYSFFSRVCWMADDGDWVIDVPRTVERTDQRLSERHRLSRTSGVTFAVTEWSGRPELIVHDLSIGGLAVLHGAPLPPLEVEDLLDGELQLPAEDPVPMCVEVRHVRHLGGPRPVDLVGLQITAITTVDRARFAGYLGRRLRDRIRE